MLTTEPKIADALNPQLRVEIQTDLPLAPVADWELRLSVATAAARLGIWDWDVVANTFVYSPRAKEIYGFALDADVTYDMVFGATHPDDSHATRANTARALDPALRENPSYEYRIIRPDGSLRWISAYGRALFDERDGEIKPIRYIGTIQDITDRMEREEALRASEARFRSLASSAPVGIFQTDASGHCQFVNERWCGLTGLTPEQAMGSGWETALHPEDRERVSHEWDAVAKGAEFSSSYRFLQPDGDVSWVQGSSRPILDMDGSIVGHMGSVMDISAITAAQQSQKVLIDELNHRVKNTLAIVQALAHLSSRTAQDAKSMATIFNARLRALARAHDVLTKELWSGALLTDIVRDTLAPFGSAQFDVSGPPVRLPPNVALSMSLALHELAVNALKYGALSKSSGLVRISWSASPQGDSEHFEFSWKEIGGPPLSDIGKPGIGLQLIRAALADMRDAESRVDFAPDGLGFSARGIVSRTESEIAR